MTSTTVRHSCEILEQSCMRSASDPPDTPSEGSTTELENVRMAPETEEVALKDNRRRSHHVERKPPDVAAVVMLRRTHDKHKVHQRSILPFPNKGSLLSLLVIKSLPFVHGLVQLLYHHFDL